MGKEERDFYQAVANILSIHNSRLNLLASSATNPEAMPSTFLEITKSILVFESSCEVCWNRFHEDEGPYIFYAGNKAQDYVRLMNILIEHAFEKEHHHKIPLLTEIQEEVITQTQRELDPKNRFVKFHFTPQVYIPFDYLGFIQDFPYSQTNVPNFPRTWDAKINIIPPYQKPSKE